MVFNIKHAFLKMTKIHKNNIFNRLSVHDCKGNSDGGWGYVS